MLTITDLTYRIQGRPLFEGASLVLPDGAKAGFVGKNGSGKTTLFRLILGQISVDAGSIEVNKRARIGAVAQEAPATELSVLETLVLRSGKVVAKKAIIESLAAFDDDLSENAVEQYVSRLRRRLAPYALTVRVARGLGYYLDRIID